MCLDLNPYLPEHIGYFERRTKLLAKASVQHNKKQSKLIAKQKGICPVCDGKLLNGETLEVHLVLAKKDGGTDAMRNLKILHKLCHKQVTYSKSDPLKAA